MINLVNWSQLKMEGKGTTMHAPKKSYNVDQGGFVKQMSFKIFFNFGHQTTQYLNLMDSFRGDKIFFETLQSRNNFLKVLQKTYSF